MHWTSEPKTWRAVREDFIQYVVPALVPSGCPYFNRAKFSGMELSLSWVGLLCSHHGLFTELMRRWCEPQSKQKAAAAASSHTSGNALRDLALLRIAAYESAQRCRSEEDDMDFQPAAPEEDVPRPTATQTGDIDWAEFNKATRKKAGQWAASNPHAAVTCIALCVQPLQSLLQRFIHLGSDAFDQKQDKSALEGCQRTFRVLEVWEGKHLRAYMDQVDDCAHCVHKAVPRTSLNESTRSFMFRLLSRGACAVEQIMAVQHRAAPFVVFAPLCGQAERLSGLKPCLCDDLAKRVLQTFPTAADLSGPEAQAMLSAMAMSMQIDILRLESLHASSRRIIHMRSCNTWCLALEELNAEWVNREMVILREMFSPAKKPAQKRRRAARPPKQKKGGGKGAGGAWRAFIHLNYKGIKLTKQICREASHAYQALKEAGGPEWLRCLQVGHLAAAAARHKVRPLKQLKRSRQPTQASIEQPVASEIQALTAESRRHARQLNEEALVQHEAAAAAMGKAAVHIQQNVVDAQHAAILQGSCFQCFPGTGAQPHVARFHVPADLLAKAGYCQIVSVTLAAEL